MNKILNVPENFVSETLEGILLASNQKLLSMDKDNRVIVSNYPCKPNKVGIVTAGGSGHLPTFLGYVGKGMLDGCTVGNVFASPSASKMADTIRACDKGSGVLCLYGNYGGDHMNFTMAREEVEFDGINTAAVRVTDDVASSKNKNLRRGVAGMVFAFKVAGAAADRMYSLEDVERVANKANDNIRSILGINFGGSEELVLFAAFWFYFTGSSLAYRDDSHINADMTSLLFKSEKAKKRMAVVKYAVSMVIAIVATAWAFQFVSWSFELWPTTPIYKLPLALSRLSIIVSFILMSIYVLIHLIRSVAILKGGEN